MSRIPACLALFVLALLATPASAQFIDLSSWTELTLDLPGGQGAGNWVLSAANTTVTQTSNADPSFFLNNANQASYTMNGTWRVTTASDDDLIGFAFGYQDAGRCYILDWKQSTQNLGGYGLRNEGFCIRKMHGATSEMTINDYWAHLDGDPQYTILATGFDTTAGWQENVLYNFSLVFNAGEFTVIVKQDETVLWEATVNDATYPSGQFAFYNYSQAGVEYSGFTQNLYPQCDAGGPYAVSLGDPVLFDGSSSTDLDGTITSWEWSFGDGAMATVPSPQHTYAAAGAYTVTLCVTDDGGLESCCETTATVGGATSVPEDPLTTSETWGTVKSLFR
jgi:chitodextrinase